MQTVGVSVPRLDAVDKVTGRAAYTGDIKLPGMAYAKMLLSPLPHARITSIDATEARQVPGGVAVLTPDQLHDMDPYYGNPSCYLLEIHGLLRFNEGDNSIPLGEEETHGRQNYSDLLYV